MNFYISTIAPDAQSMARQNGLGLEIAEYCTAYNMDENFTETDSVVKQKLQGIPNRVLHAPFNELFPCAIDPKARELAAYRYRQAIDLACAYGAEKIVIHGGYNPRIYYPCWYTEQSVIFWNDFLKEIPGGIQICLENVLEEEPDMLLDIIREVDDPRLQMCLDVGHVNTYSQIPVMQWLENCAPYSSHFHIHNNDGNCDVHGNLPDGTIPMKELLDSIALLCPKSTLTLEVLEAEPSIRYLMEQGFLEV